MKKNAEQLNQEIPPVQNRAYILRLWRAGQNGMCNWRASLEDPHTGERFGFAGLEQLFAYLMELSERDSGSCPLRKE